MPLLIEGAKAMTALPFWSVGSARFRASDEDNLANMIPVD